MIKIVFTAQYPVETLKPEILLSRDIESHPVSWIQILSKELAKNSEVDLHLVTVSTAVAKNQIIRKDNITYHVLKSPIPRNITKTFRLPDTSTLIFPASLAMLQCIKRIRPHLVHGHGTEGAFSLPAVYSGLPHVISIQGIITKVCEEEPSKRYKVIRYIENHALRKAKAINAKIKFTYSYVTTIAPNAKYYCIEDAADPVFWENPVPPPRKNLFFAGTLIKRKGIEEWLCAFSKLKELFPSLQGYIIGKGEPDYEKYLYSLVEEKQLTNGIHFTGQINHIKMSEIFKKGGIFCFPSYIETNCLVVMESMASGLPVVATKVGGLSQAVEDGRSGFLVKARDVTGLVKSCSYIFNNNDVHSQFGKKGREIASSRWKPEIIANKHLDMYKSLLNK